MGSRQSSVPKLLANVSRLVAYAELDLKNAPSEENVNDLKNRIGLLTEIRNQILDEDQKLVEKYRTKLNSMLREMESSSETDSTRKAQKRKAGSDDEPLYKRKKENKNTVAFVYLPCVLQNSIFEKFDYRRFTIFDQCSQFSNTLCLKSKKRFYLRKDYVAFQDNTWKFKPRPGVAGDILSPKQMKNVFLNVSCVKVNSVLTDDACLTIMSQVKAPNLFCMKGISCSQEKFHQMTETLCVRNFSVQLTEGQADFPYDTSNIKEVNIEASGLSAEAVLNLKALDSLILIDEEITHDAITAKIKSLIDECDYSTHFYGNRLSIQEVSNLLEIFGNRAKLTDGTINCWGISNGKSPSPCLFVVHYGVALDVLPRDEFYSSFSSMARFP